MDEGLRDRYIALIVLILCSVWITYISIILDTDVCCSEPIPIYFPIITAFSIAGGGAAILILIGS